MSCPVTTGWLMAPKAHASQHCKRLLEDPTAQQLDADWSIKIFERNHLDVGGGMLGVVPKPCGGLSP